MIIHIDYEPNEKDFRHQLSTCSAKNSGLVTMKN